MKNNIFDKTTTTTKVWNRERIYKQHVNHCISVIYIHLTVFFLPLQPIVVSRRKKMREFTTLRLTVPAIIGILLLSPASLLSYSPLTSRRAVATIAGPINNQTPVTTYPLIQQSTRYITPQANSDIRQLVEKYRTENILLYNRENV